MAHISGVGAFFIIIAVIVVLGVAAWIVYTNLRARRLGLPRPTLASYNPFDRPPAQRYGSQERGGIAGWVSSKVRALKNRNDREAGGAYEGSGFNNARGARVPSRGFGPLDPDDAWDARVGNEADTYGPGGYYEEQELGVHSNAIAPTPISANPKYDEDRGRPLSKGPEPYVGASHTEGDNRGENPFDDPAGPSNTSLRGVSPRPIVDARPQGHLRAQDSIDSHTERRSLFREDV